MLSGLHVCVLQACMLLSQRSLKALSGCIKAVLWVYWVHVTGLAALMK